MVYDHSICPLVQGIIALQRITVLLLFANPQPAYVRRTTEGLLDCNRLRRSRRCSTTADLVDSVVFMLLRLRNRVHSVVTVLFQIAGLGH
jgi:hypothetical protein